MWNLPLLILKGQLHAKKYSIIQSVLDGQAQPPATSTLNCFFFIEPVFAESAYPTRISPLAATIPYYSSLIELETLLGVTSRSLAAVFLRIPLSW